MKQQWAKHIELGVSMNKIDLIIYALELARNEIHDPTLWTDKVDKALAAARELKALAQPEQEPVGWFAKGWQGVYVELMPEAKDAIPLYTAPRKREWVGLTIEEIKEMLYGLHGDDQTPMLTLVNVVEAKLKEKNA